MDFLPLLQAFNLLMPVGLVALGISTIIAAAYHFIATLPFLRRFAFFLMFAFFGTTLGCIVGGAESSETATVVTSLITLASGYLTYLTGKEKEIDDAVKVLLPGAFICFLNCLLFSMFYMRFYFAPQTVS